MARQLRFFTNPNAVETEDTQNSLDELRFSIIGYSTRRILFVVFAERHADLIRIISARRPTATERKLYAEEER
ncbi:MAG: BrnT family toxin [Acidobacteriota bacterium]